jgi:hypothetical protein
MRQGNPYMKTNPYHKFLTKEDNCHHAILTWFKWNYPKMKIHHSPNEGRRSEFERFKYSYLGSDNGFPDLMIPEIKLILEIKIKPNRVSQAQKEWMEYFKSIGWRAEVAWTFEEAVGIIEEEVQKLKMEKV